MNNPSSQVCGVSNSSPSLYSEPPNIKNWFLSYTYQSPVLDSNEDFCISPSRVDEEEYEKTDLCVEDSDDEKVENYVGLSKIRKAPQSNIDHMKDGCHSIAYKTAKEAKKLEFIPDAEIPAYPDSLPFPSEPPDITNWFSSYAYESLELDSADFEFSISPKRTSTDSETTIEEIKEHNNEVTTKDIVESITCKEIISSGSGMNCIITGTKYSAAQAHISEGNTYSSEKKLCSKGRYLDNYCVNSDDSAQSQRRPAKNLTPLIHEVQEINNADNLILSANAPCSKTFSETREHKTQNVVSDNQSGWIQLNRKSREEHYNNSKQDVKQHKRTKPVIASPMKISTSRLYSENDFRKKIDNNIHSVGLLGNKRTGPVRREVLKETTNTQYNCAQEPSEKWRCPQKSKPYIGPPLKQLRLERWVHRV